MYSKGLASSVICKSPNKLESKETRTAVVEVDTSIHSEGSPLSQGDTRQADTLHSFHGAIPSTISDDSMECKSVRRSEMGCKKSVASNIAPESASICSSSHSNVNGLIDKGLLVAPMSQASGEDLHTQNSGAQLDVAKLKEPHVSDHEGHWRPSEMEDGGQRIISHSHDLGESGGCSDSSKLQGESGKSTRKPGFRSLSLSTDGLDSKTNGLLAPFRTMFKKSKDFVTVSMCQYHAAPTSDENSQFTELLDSILRRKMAWYFRANVYRLSLILILILCCCVWLVPLRLFPGLINTARLVRVARSIGGDVLLSVFLSRELALDDGFSRMNSSLMNANLRQSRRDITTSLDALRFGGTDVEEANTVATGADSISSTAMDQYKRIMYQDGCPWRQSDDCSLESWPLAPSEGLYKYLVHFYRAVGIVRTKFAPNLNSPDSYQSRP